MIKLLYSKVVVLPLIVKELNMLITSSWQWDLTIILGTLLLLLYQYTRRAQQYWQKKGVYTPKTIKPIIGHFLDIVLMRKTMSIWLKDFYNSTNEKYFGLYIFDEHFFVIRDPELVKQVLTRDFSYFQDRYVGVPKHDEVQSNLMFMQKNPTWRMIRTKMTPAFTSGKLKSMMPLIQISAEEMVEFIINHQGVCEAKELIAKYSTNVIARCSFGINAKCFTDERAIFREYGKRMFKNSWRNAFCQTIYFMKPSLINKLKINFVEKECLEYFSKVVLDIIHNRSDTERHNDLIDTMKSIKKNNDSTSQKMDDDKIAGTAIQFFMAGFESSSSTISFALYEMCLNTSIQDKLRREINDIIDKFGEISYESIKKMHYLDMCMQETLRKYPVLPFLDRICNRDYNVPGTDLVLEQGTGVFIPLSGLQLDENYFPNPLKFDPENFYDKFRSKSGSDYLPFGDGPRSCIGERFGRLIVKLGLIHIIKNFAVEKCKETPNSVEFDPRCFLLTSRVGLPMIFKQLKT